MPPNETETPFSYLRQIHVKQLWKPYLLQNASCNSVLAYTSGVPGASVVGFPIIVTPVACLLIPQHKMQIPTQAVGPRGQNFSIFFYVLCKKMMLPYAQFYLNSRCGKLTNEKNSEAGSIASHDLGSGNYFFPSLPMHGSLLASDDFNHSRSRVGGSPAPHTDREGISEVGT